MHPHILSYTSLSLLGARGGQASRSEDGELGEDVPSLLCASSSSLRPSLKPMVKSRILQTCFQSLYGLPPTETLKGCLPPLQSVPNVTVTVLLVGPATSPGGQLWVLGHVQHSMDHPFCCICHLCTSVELSGACVWLPSWCVSCDTGLHTCLCAKWS